MPKPPSPHRLLLFDEREEASGSVLGALADAFAVTRVKSFVEAVPHLGQVQVAMVYLPEPDFVRNTFLAEARQAAPSLTVVALSSSVTDSLQQVLARFGVSALLPAATSAPELVRALHDAMASRGEQS